MKSWGRCSGKWTVKGSSNQVKAAVIVLAPSPKHSSPDDWNGMNWRRGYGSSGFWSLQKPKLMCALSCDGSGPRGIVFHAAPSFVDLSLHATPPLPHLVSSCSFLAFGLGFLGSPGCPRGSPASPEGSPLAGSPPSFPIPTSCVFWGPLPLSLPAKIQPLWFSGLEKQRTDQLPHRCSGFNMFNSSTQNT